VTGADTTHDMSKSSRANPGKEMVTVYGKISKDLADRLDALAEQRRWSRAQMVAYCIEQFIEQNDGAAGEQKKEG
jgi:predicted transcriptional regulator